MYHLRMEHRGSRVTLEKQRPSSNNWENVQALVIHMLTPFSAETLLSSKHRFPVLWLAWGCDVYNATPTLEWRLYQPQTLQYFSSNGSHRPIWYAKAIIRCILQKTGIYGNRRDRNHFRAIKACTFCAPVFPSEEAAIRKHCNFKGRFLRFSYGDYASENTSPGPESAPAENILVGNSSSPTSNQLDVFQLLQRLHLGSRKVIVPLSYGDLKYRDYVLKRAGGMLGDNFVPIVDFLPLKDYTSLVRTCGICIFNHKRQQAVGNILMGLQNGAKVCLPETNPVYSYFQGLGARLFCLNRDLTQQLLDCPLEDHFVKINREIVRQEYGREALLDRVGRVVRVLLETAEVKVYGRNASPN